MSTTLHAAWARIGGGFSGAAAKRRADPEALIAATLAAAPRDPRLFWVAAGWLAVHHTLVNPRRLGRRLASADEKSLAVGGALFTLAHQHAAAPATQLGSILRHCRPLQTPRPLFDVMQENAVLRAKVREGTLPEFARWGVWQDDVSIRLDAIRPVSWVLAHAPEFRSRALFGANAEAEVLDLLLALPATVQDMAEMLEMTYAAVHEAASRLVARGWLRRVREGRRQVLSVREELRGWIGAFPGDAAA